ncbi:unnamed protein product [Ceratitis capitata]|uniref:(Mediterranean fruit fly) hypothetical protein n=1 Tax=Ceratitis capitata TaxID=7213 RepID=A0A811V4M1_CERCA|nr:unnamed protein product [Ceratitis capitata]
MEVMEEGNLMDRVPVLLQRDLQFYQTHQRVLQERICLGVVGGKLDFPRYASFAAIKIVLWWEDEYFASYQKHSGLLHAEWDLLTQEPPAVIVKTSDPEKFVNLVTRSADMLLEHLHVLSQESLDHADLSVLTATIGAAALIKNCLHIYMQAANVKIYRPKGNEKGGALRLSYKQYFQMAEALAERLLDLHCRLLLLYIVQDTDCLNWENSQPFFESERGSYTIQMWWHYIQGIKDDLWNSVPPKMAQRIFAGILNETLGVLSARYSLILTSVERAQLHLADISNMLFCVAELLPYICESGEAYIGLQLTAQNAIIRDVHAKCRELFYCLLLRGAPLGVLSKLCRKNIENMEMFSSRQGLPCAWILFASPRLFSTDKTFQWVTEFGDLSARIAISLELKVLLAFPEADWAYLLKTYFSHLPSPENFKNENSALLSDCSERKKCEAFLCRGECLDLAEQIKNQADPIGQSNYQIALSLTYLLVAVGKAADIKSCLIKILEESSAGWSDCLDKRQVWNQKRPPWLEAIMHFVYPVLNCIVDMLVNAVEAGASMYQAMSLALTCVSEMWDCMPESLYKVTILLQDIIPVSTRPLENKMEKASTCYSISEAICCIDEDDKHTDQIDLFLKQTRDSITIEANSHFEYNGGARSWVSTLSTVKIDDLNNTHTERLTQSPPTNYASELDVGVADYIADILVSDVLTSNFGKQALKTSYRYLKNNSDWLMEQLGAGVAVSGPNLGQRINEPKDSILSTMFFVGSHTFDQLLSGVLSIDYITWLQTPLSLNTERAWLHLSRRCDFQEDSKLRMPEVTMVAGITQVMKKLKYAKKF